MVPFPLEDSTAFVLYAFGAIVLPWSLSRLPRVRAIAPLGVVQLCVAMAFSPPFLSALFAQAARPERLVDSHALFAPAGWLALMCFVFLIGGRARSGEEGQGGRGVLLVAAGSLLAPLLCGVMLGRWLEGVAPDFVGPRAGGLFALSVGVCLAVTALPVLALIARDLDIDHRPCGRAAVAVAFLHDIVLWALIAAVLGLAADGSLSWLRAGRPLLLAATLVLTLLFAARPALDALWRRRSRGPETALISAMALMLLCSAASDAAGLHLATGAFLAGVIAPADLFERAAKGLEPLTSIVLLPMFFLSVAGLIPRELDLSQLSLVAPAVLVAAVLTKYVSAAGLARVSGWSWRESLAIGGLLQSKGLMEVVALTMLHEGGVVTGPFVTCFLFMSVVTTGLAKPLVRLSERSRPEEAAGALQNLRARAGE